MFSEQFRKRIEVGKYTRWAKDLTEEHLEALLWAVGEYGYRSHHGLDVLREHPPRDPVAHARAMVGLEVLADFSARRPINMESLQERIGAALAPYKHRSRQTWKETDTET